MSANDFYLIAAFIFNAAIFSWLMLCWLFANDRDRGIFVHLVYGWLIVWSVSVLWMGFARYLVEIMA